MPFGDRLKENKMVQWALAYAAGAWLILQFIDTVEGPWGLPEGMLRGLHVLIVIGFVATLVFAWYHGEQGRQHVSGPELLILASVMGVGGLVLSLVAAEDIESTTRTDGDGQGTALEARPGIAVLPFESNSTDPDDAYFAAGVHGELLTALSRIAGLRVIGETSVVAYSETEKTIPVIGAELDARYLVEGDVQRAGSDVRINLRLNDTERDGIIWSDLFQRELTAENLFDVQSEIVTRLAGELRVEMSDQEAARLARVATSSDRAYDLYMRAKALSRAPEREPRERAVELLEEALRHDPDFVEAQADLAGLHALLYQYFADYSPERLEAARTAARSALELDSLSPTVQRAYGTYLYRVERDFEGALQWLDRGAGTLTGDSGYHLMRGAIERRSGRWEAAVASFRNATVLNPRAGWAWYELAGTLQLMRRFAEAEQAGNRTVEIFPNEGRFILAELELTRDGEPGEWAQRELEASIDWRLARAVEWGEWDRVLTLSDSAPPVLVEQALWRPTAIYRGWALRELGRHDEAARELSSALVMLEAQAEIESERPRVWSALGLTYALRNEPGEAVAAVDRALGAMPIDQDPLQGALQLYWAAVTYALIGDEEAAIRALDTVMSVPGDYSTMRIERQALFESLRDDARFREVMDRHRGRVF